MTCSASSPNLVLHITAKISSHNTDTVSLALLLPPALVKVGFPHLSGIYIQIHNVASHSAAGDIPKFSLNKGPSIGR
jgi:hypothetical protein